MPRGILDQIKSANLRRHQAERKCRRPCDAGPPRTAWGKLEVRGVYQVPSGRYEAKLRIAGRLVRLGTFATIDDAARAVVDAEARGLGGGAREPHPMTRAVSFHHAGAFVETALADMANPQDRDRVRMRRRTVARRLKVPTHEIEVRPCPCP